MSGNSCDIKSKRNYSETFRKQKENAQRRKDNMDIRVFELKIDYSHCNKEQKDYLKTVFIEGKWFYNAAIAFGESSSDNKPWKYDYKKKTVIHFDKDKNPIESEFKFLNSQSKQAILKRIAVGCKSLKTNLKKNNIKNTKGLTFKSEFNNISFPQYGNGASWSFKKSGVKLLKCEKPFKVHGYDQLQIEGIEFASLDLVQKPTGYYLYINCYVPKQHERKHNHQTIGLDFGCENTLTYYVKETRENGKLNFVFDQNKKEKRLQRRITRRRIKNFSNKTNKAIRLRNGLRKRFEKQKNRKEDTSNQIVSWLKTFEKVILQDEMLSKWQKSGHGKKIQRGILGRLKTKLKNCGNVFVLDKTLPTSKFCFDCLSKNNQLKLWNRMFICPNCGSASDRDVHAAKNMIEFYEMIRMVPTEYREPKKFNIFFNELLNNIEKRVEKSSSESLLAMIQDLSKKHEATK